MGHKLSTYEISEEQVGDELILLINMIDDDKYKCQFFTDFRVATCVQVLLTTQIIPGTSSVLVVVP